MDKALKQRMVGAVVLIALGVIFIPMLLDGGSKEEGTRRVELDIPAAPDREYRSRRLPLNESDVEPAETSPGQVERDPGEPVQEAPTDPAPSPGQPVSDAEDVESGGDTGDAEADAASPDEPVGDEPASPEVETDPSPPAPGTPESDDEALANWFVQVGSFSQQANATDLRDRLRDAGYTAFVESSTVEGQTKHRVKVGPEMDRDRAERQLEAIRSEFDLKGIVVSEP